MVGTGFEDLMINSYSKRAKRVSPIALSNASRTVPWKPFLLTEAAAEGELVSISLVAMTKDPPGRRDCIAIFNALATRSAFVCSTIERLLCARHGLRTTADEFYAGEYMNLPATQRVGQSLESALHQIRRHSVTLIAANRHHVIIHGGLRAAGNARRKIDWQYAFTRSLARAWVFLAPGVYSHPRLGLPF
jgi:hypothetical protein